MKCTFCYNSTTVIIGNWPICFSCYLKEEEKYVDRDKQQTIRGIADPAERLGVIARRAKFESIKNRLGALRTQIYDVEERLDSIAQDSSGLADALRELRAEICKLASDPNFYFAGDWKGAPESGGEENVGDGLNGRQ